MTTVITISFLFSTYFFQKKINSLIHKDILDTLEEKNLKLKEDKIDEISRILTDYNNGYDIEEVLMYLSIFPVFNVICAVHNAYVYNQQKDIVFSEIEEANVLEPIINTDSKQIILEDTEKNRYFSNDLNPKIKVNKKSR